MTTGTAEPTPPTPGRRRWPADAGNRTLVRVALAWPLAVLAVLAGRAFVSSGHGQAEQQAAALVGGGADLHGLGAAYPPVPTLLATVLPGGATMLGVVAAIFAGLTLQLLWEQLMALELPNGVIAALLSTLFAVPAVAFLASQAVAGIASISLITVALLGFVRFTVNGSTEGGFVAGLAFALAFLTSPIALFYALAAAGSTVFLARGRFRATPGAALATVGVLLFPTVCVACSWAFLEWRFAGTAFGALVGSPTFLAFPGGVGASLLAATTTVGLGLVHVPLYVVCGVLAARVRPLSLVGYVLPLIGSVVAVWLGLTFTAITIYVFLTILALAAAVPARPGRRVTVLLVTTAVVQLVLAWVWPPTSSGFRDWASVLLGLVGLG